ncbi:hypothetical protein C8R44DRAFT_23955 [Mycena epipterygia]|nr:hypothetical protein C8R44DRAFT_23955 [Mycena epipterygia]
MTTRRPPLKQRPRPSSQVYIGSDSTYSSYLSNPPDLPDLPEPPSPGSSSSTSTSGLPSPPATNSTGSGSTGDPGSIAVRGGLNMLNGSNIKTFHAAFQADPHDDELDDYDNDNDDDGEDNTARLNQRRHSANENVLALQRVKSLTQRNKMALDKLSSFSRLSSPSPSARPASTTRSPHPPVPSIIASSSGSGSNSNSTSSYSSSSHSSTSNVRPSIRRARTQDHQSGSETERDDLPAPVLRPTTPLPPTRQRLVSAPASPQKHLAAAASSSSGSNSSTRSPRRSRVSNLSFSRMGDEDGGPSSPEDITRAALAAVASARNGTVTGTARYTGTRMSPTSTAGSGKRRQPLPREWGAESSNGRFSAEPPTSPPQHDTSPNKRHSLAGSTTSQHSRGHTHSNSTSSTSTIGSTAAGRERASTVRELARRHQTRWLSEDMGSNNGAEERERERRQSLRAGSAESALGAGRSLVGEGLRAAGLAVRAGGGGDVFTQHPERERTPARVEWAEGTHSRSQSRLGHGHGRAATSMADYASPRREEYAYDNRDVDDGGEPRTAPPLRTYRSSAHVLDAGAGGRAGSALGRYRGASVERDGERERHAPSPSPFGSMRRHGGGGGSGQQEHTKLMGDSLAMFEGHLGRIAGGGPGVRRTSRGAHRRSSRRRSG